MPNEISPTRDGYVECAHCHTRRPKAAVYARTLEGKPAGYVCADNDYCARALQQWQENHPAEPKQEQTK